MLWKQKPTLEATIYGKYTHANSVLASVLCFFTTHVAKQNGTTCRVLGEIKELDSMPATFIEGKESYTMVLLKRVC